jgi:hypothetical protein
VTPAIVEQGDADVFAVRVGDCLDMATGEVVETVPVVPCDEPHSDEVFHDFAVADGEFPGDDELASAAEDGCIAAFDSFVGVAYADSVLSVGWYVPTEDSWTYLDDRLITCVIADPAGAVVGSLAGAAY